MSMPLLVLAASLCSSSWGCKRRTVDPPRATVPSAATDAKVEDADSRDGIIEDAQRFAVQAWSFELDRYEMKIEDVAMSAALDAVLERTGADLVVNGGFFDPDGHPLGLAISDGAVLSRLAPSMSGGVVTSDGVRARLWEAESFVLGGDVRFAIQCRPRLVVNGAPNVRRDDGQRAERTTLCLRDGGRTVEVVIAKSSEGHASGPSLFATSGFLARRGCEEALNLDGGPSTGVAWRENGTIMRVGPRSGVRHAVTFVRRVRSARPEGR